MAPVEYSASAGYVTYAVFALISYVIPGPDWAVILPKALQGKRLGIATAVGVQSGLLFHGGLAILGVGAALAAFPTALAALQALGGLYLVWLGVVDILSTRGEESQRPKAEASHVLGLRGAFCRGLLVNVLNPKAALFFVAVLPQFVDPANGTISALVLVLLDIALGLMVWCVIVLACSWVAQRAVGPQTQKWGALAMACVLIIVGVFFASRALFEFPVHWAG